MKPITKEKLEQLIKTDKLILVDFSATWCGPCQMMTPALEEIEEEYKKNDKIKIVTVDIDENPEIATKYSVMSVPTFIFFKEGKVVDSVVGACAKDNLLEKIEKLLK